MPGTGEPEVTRPVHQPSLADAIIPLVALTVLIAGSLLLFGLDALDGPIQVALILCVLTAALIALKNGHSWDEIEHLELHKLADIYHMTPWNLLPLLLLGVLSFRKVPAVLALTASTLFAGILGAFLQPQVMSDFVGASTGAVVGSIKGIWRAMANGFSINSGIGEIDRLLSRGGMDSMLKTIWLIIGAVTFGVLLEHFGLISRLVKGRSWKCVACARNTGAAGSCCALLMASTWR